MAAKPNRVPVATYRLQFNRQFTFAQAREILGYLAELGVSDVYASPIFLAGPESTHGYDVCGFDRINPNLGTAEDFKGFTADIKSNGLGLLLDMVPNHMGTCSDNIWWRDVLRNGRHSKFANYFDVDWDARSDHKVLLPVLGDRYGEVLRRGELRLDFQDGEICIANFNYPLSPEAQESLKREANFREGDPGAVHALKRVLQAVNEDRERLHAIIQAQHYRLAFWRVGPHEINYRRFFDVTGLVCLRVEDKEVFDATHRFVFELIKSGQVTGLRIDHPDGLRDPKTYFDRLHEPFAGSLFVVVEKILSKDERLPEDWAVCGTTGYDYLNYLNGIFMARENAPQFTDIYGEFTGETSEYAAVEHVAKKRVLKSLFPKALHFLAGLLREIADQTVDGVDLTTAELEEAIVEFIAAFPVYRTYARVGVKTLAASEQKHVAEAVELAARRSPAIAPALEFLRKRLLLEGGDSNNKGFTEQCVEFVVRFQQLTGPASAKGVEDTAFYRYLRFVSLNEVGGNPEQFGVSVEAFHRYNEHKENRWPHSLLATSTHDTKRGEDVRARLNVLSEMPAEWHRQVQQWSDWNRHFRTEGMPDSRDEYLLYQTVVGSWTGDESLETYISRIQQYMEKATREAKLRTSWTDLNPPYEEATRQFIDSILWSEKFRESLDSFVRRVAFFGVFNSLAQVLLKVCSPGVPDFYQGTELWDFNLVDPDNRRPVDYAKRQELLRHVKNTDPKQLLARSEAGEIKMFVTWAALQIRNRHRELFENGSYVPIEASGSRREHVISFGREHGGKRIVAIAPRLPLTLMDGQTKPPIGPEAWGEDTELNLPPGKYRDRFTRKTRESKKLAELLADFPIALLEST
jgi:(1->4)-alpha-D-glucan 1-alpha-D-glucosylmutase